MQNIGLMEIDVVTRPVRIHAAIVVGVAIIVYMRFITLIDGFSYGKVYG